MVQQEVGYRISDSPSDNPTIKKSDNPLPVRALKNRVKNIPINFENPTFWTFERRNLRLGKVSTLPG